MKRILSVILTVLMIASVAVGCSSGVSGSSESAVGDYPKRQINMYVGFGAGGSSDLGVRTLMPYLEKELGATINVVNKTGANGWIAWTEISKAAPDGYTMGLVNIPGFYSGYLDKQQNRSENLESFQFVANSVSDWGVLIVKKDDERFSDMVAFMKYAKNNKVTVADVGLGGNKHMVTEEMLIEHPELKLEPVHMKGFADNYSGVLGGHVDSVSATVGDVYNRLGEDKVKILCVFAPKRSKLLPDVPTCEELGFGAIYGPSYRGYLMPKGTDPELLKKIQSAFEKAINNPEHIEKMKKLGFEVDYFAGKEYETMLKKNEEKARTMAKKFGWQ